MSREQIVQELDAANYKFMHVNLYENTTDNTQNCFILYFILFVITKTVYQKCDESAHFLWGSSAEVVVARNEARGALCVENDDSVGESKHCQT